MTLRPALIVCIAGLFALPVTTFAADAIDGATSVLAAARAAGSAPATRASVRNSVSVTSP